MVWVGRGEHRRVWCGCGVCFVRYAFLTIKKCTSTYLIYTITCLLNCSNFVKKYLTRRLILIPKLKCSIFLWSRFTSQSILPPGSRMELHCWEPSTLTRSIRWKINLLCSSERLFEVNRSNKLLVQKSLLISLQQKCKNSKLLGSKLSSF